MFPLIEMRKINSILQEPTLNMYRYTIKNNATIVDTDKGCFVFKKKNGNDVSEIYDYLKSRNFEYYPKLVRTDELYNVYEYIEDTNMPYDQKALDMVYLLSLLHNKTTYYKEMDADEYKELYEKLLYDIENINSYYTNLITMIEKEIYMSPSQYLIARNISKIYASLYYARIEIDNWYELIKNKNRKRIVTIYNNNDIDHLLRNKDLYLINWEKSKMDIPIYDFYYFYRKHALEFDFNDLLKVYEENYPFLEEEKKLLFILMSIPDIVTIKENEFDNCRNVKEIIDYIYKTETLIFPKEESTTTN